MDYQLGHVNLAVNNLQESVDFYCKHFGWKMFRYADRGNCLLAWVGPEDRNPTSFLELHFEKDQPERGPVTVNSDYHFCVMVENRAEQKALWEKHHAAQLDYLLSSNSYFIHDVNGHCVEILSRESYENMVAGRNNPYFLSDEEKSAAIKEIEARG